MELTSIDTIAFSNSSGKASPDDIPKSPPESLDAKSSLDADTASSKESS